MSGDYSIGSKVWPGLSKMIEECGELLQVAGKLIGSGGETAHWDGTDLRERLIEEMGDVTAALIFFSEHNEVPGIADRAERKLDLFEEWHNAAFVDAAA